MAIALDVAPEDVPAKERAPGDFYRPAPGKVYVSDPTGELVKSGPRKGLPKWAPYGRPSSLGKLIENTYNLQKWSERSVALGIGTRLELIAGCAALAGRDRDTEEWRADADKVVVAALDAAKTALAAERGTHGHALTEDDDEERDWILRAERGEVLGLDRGVQANLVEAWRLMLERSGLVILAVEQPIVHDGYRMAGTLDRIAMLTRDLRFTLITGEVVELKAGTIVVLDIKTGKRRTERNGVVMYWHAYSVQIAVYAGGVPYDTTTDTRGQWEWEIDQRWALIAHLDILAAIAGKPVDQLCQLVLVDIEAGRHAADLCMAAKAWEKRNDVFSITQLADADGIASCSLCGGAGLVTVGDGDYEGAGSHEEPCPNCDTASSTVPATVDASPAESATAGDPQPEQDPPPAPAAPTSSTEPAAVDDTPPAAPTPSEAPPPPRSAQLAAIPANPDEGPVVADSDFEALEGRYNALPNEAQAWLVQLMKDAMKKLVSFHGAQAHTLRRFEIIRGLVHLAEQDGADDELLRALVALALDIDISQLPAVTTGHAVGALNAAQAATFAQLVDRFAAGELVGLVGDDELFRLREQAPTPHQLTA